MAALPTKHLVLVTLFLLCFISTSTTQGRNLSMKIPQPPNLANEKGEEMVARKEELPDSEELAVVDYSPARKKTPIHN
ncbi:hypothetical protein Pfo_018642 [Paulownia fortunei]|nr:hypothetical protein Pfo_018642 [Paulownia fortunei]